MYCSDMSDPPMAASSKASVASAATCSNYTFKIIPDINVITTGTVKSIQYHIYYMILYEIIIRNTYSQQEVNNHHNC